MEADSLKGCAVRCWENTKYVSKCLNDNTCLCNEAKYQNVRLCFKTLPFHQKLWLYQCRHTNLYGWQSVFQCLYSQCDTAQFGSALHHAISQCSGTGGEFLLTVPPVANHDVLRRREAQYLAGEKLFGTNNMPILN
jgi:hypothetical protein